MKTFGEILSKIEDTLHLVGCLSLVIVVVVINADILMRLILGVPVQFQFELTEYYLMPALATLSLAWVFRDGGHLALDFVPEFSGFPGKVIVKLRLLLSAAFFGVVTYMSGKHAVAAFVQGKTEFGVINWPLGWAYSVVPLGCGVLAARLIYDALQKDASQNEAPKPIH